MADVVRIRLLGEFEASSGERVVAPGAWRLRKAKTVVKLLALEPSHTLHRDRVVEALWPGSDPAAARNNLHQVVHAARKALATLAVDGAKVLLLHDDLLVLGGEIDVVTDVEQLVANVERARASGDVTELTRALSEHSGELLPEDAYEPWVQRRADTLREWRVQQVMDVVDEQLAAADADAAVVLLSPVVAADGFHEPAARAMMRALAAAGRRSEALLFYERLRKLLRDELGADPEPDTRKVFRDLLAAGAADSDTVGVPAQGPASNLPAPVGPLVGRDRELLETSATLARTRLLTLTGMGGAGKTTLAIELGRRSVTDFPGGVYLVELAGVSDSDAVVPQIARALRMELPSDSAPIDSMIAQLGQRRTLVVLDNCEHVIEACARVVSDLLRGCPELTVLATSREPLRIDGEISWRTPSLQLPDPGRTSTTAELAEIASIELFVQRAAAALPGFALTDDNAQSVAEICFRLDGIPLALELAAACIPTLSPQQIADRLGDALTLLSRGGRATITRQQTLTATLTWSHELLDEPEQVLFRRLSVFAGSFTLEAIEGVCGARLEQPGVLPAVARLVDTSLLVAEVRAGVARYRMLETVRQFANEQLQNATELAALQDRHCGWYLTFVQQHDPERSARVAGSAASSLDVDHDNLRAALRWSLQHKPTAALELVVGLSHYWLARGFFAEGRRWLEAALSVAPAPTALRCRALLALAVFDVRRGDDERLAALGSEAVAIQQSLGDPEGLAQSLRAEAVLSFMRGAWEESWDRTVEAQNTAATAEAPHVAAAARYVQAVILMSRGSLADARVALEDVRAWTAKLPATITPFLPPMFMGFSVDGARTSAPRIYFEETVLLGRYVDAEQVDAYILCNLADIARLDGDHDAAMELARDARARFVALGDYDGEALAAGRMGCLHRVRGEYPAGREALSHSLRMRRSIGDRRSIALTLGNLAALTAAEGDLPRGAALVAEALESIREIQDGAADVGLRLTLASIHAEAGDYEMAERLLTDALPQSTRIPGNHRITAWAYATLADVHTRLGRPDDAARAARESRQRFSALGAVDLRSIDLSEAAERVKSRG